MKKILLSTVLSISLYADTPPCFNPIGTIDWTYFGDQLVFFNGACICNLNEGSIAGGAATTKAGWKVSLVEPIGAMESSHKSWEFPCLDIDIDDSVSAKFGTTGDGGDGSGGFVDQHFIIYPVFSILNFVQEYLCFERASLMSLSLMSELFPQNDVYAMFIKPQVLLTSNPIAQALCALDCVSCAVGGKPLNHLSWCNGCMPPLDTDTKFTYGKKPLPEATSNAVEMLSQGHRELIFSKTSDASFASTNSEAGVLKDSMCQETIYLENIKTQYAFNLGLPTVWDAYKPCTHPMVLDMKNKLTNKDNAVMWTWRKRDFCAGAYVCRSTFQNAK